MKKLEYITMISQSFNKVCEQLTSIVESLNEIKKLMDSKKDKISDLDDEDILAINYKNINPNEKIDRKQAANILRISVKTLDRYRQKGIIPFSQVLDGGKVTFKYKDILAFQSKIKEHKRYRSYISDFTSDLNN